MIIYPIYDRFLLRCAKFAQSQHTRSVYRRYGGFDCTEAQCTQIIPPRSGPADDDYEVAMCAPSIHLFALWNAMTDSRTLDYLFFGTITYVEEAIRNLLEAAQWTRNPIRFLVLDFSLVPGVDLSASEALVRIQHLLVSKRVTLVLCGFTMESSVALAFQSVELFEGQNVEVFLDISQAIEWTENVYLKAWFDSVKGAEPEAKAMSEFTNILLPSIYIEMFFCIFSFPWATKIHSGTQRFIS